MNRTPVASTNLKSIGFETINGIGVLEIEFQGGAVYRYSDVPQHHYDTLLYINQSGGSLGHYFNAYIKDGGFQFERVNKTSDPRSILTPQEQLIVIADALDKAERRGAEKDEPEGARTIIVSDTLAKDISARLRRIAEQISQSGG